MSSEALLEEREKWQLEVLELKQQLKMAEQELRITRHAFETQDGMIVTDANNVILRVNRAFTRLTGYSQEEVIGTNPSILKSGRQNAAFYRRMWDTLRKHRFWQGEVWDKRKDGSIYPKLLTITAVADENNEVVNYIGTFSDVSQQKEAKENIYRLAFYDPLTQLPNRRLLMDRLSQALAGSLRNHSYGAVLFIDLDNFKTLNDTKGHDFGDLLLIEVAARLRNCIRQGDTVARFGGDEFLVILEGVSYDEDIATGGALNVAEKVCKAISHTYTLKGYNYHCTASIGISMFHGDDFTVHELLRRADTAMYQAKHTGRNTFCLFNPHMQHILEQRALLEADLRQALARDQFRLYYQMQVDAQQRAYGAEVLLRWQHPERGIVSPAHFIELAEETGLILPIGHYVLISACRQLKQWEQEESTRDLMLSVNVSIMQLSQADFVEQVKAILETTKANPNRLKIELTESLVLDSSSSNADKMAALQQLGIHFAMDDFGTGYSSLIHLKRLPLNQLKIDRSFVGNIDHNLNDAVIVKTIIAMANALDLEVIAEGVETEAQLELLRQYGCFAFQGYLFSQPVCLEEFHQLLLLG
ncbi:EAL domain-containing protein [Methylobacillus caricis]|uniref:putative bifunctional diguanylate cyclase/phosphodiesterase n=1 Tax=Methylobacillus caricis TaxID=1971611 RepID=UPI001CFFCFC9|nr:EAL domain-containing protein [Methylobacillus caricis]MCB5187467.1 EAL domain-containing protein [Methylobacillus caricis]